MIDTIYLTCTQLLQYYLNYLAGLYDIESHRRERYRMTQTPLGSYTIKVQKKKTRDALKALEPSNFFCDLTPDATRSLQEQQSKSLSKHPDEILENTNEQNVP